MPTYFHVHRGPGLSPGLRIELEHFDAPVNLRRHLSDLFPDGLTQHGATYLGLVPDRAADVRQNGWREAILEFVRRSIAPGQPSRLQSVFACGSLDDARAFLENLGQRQGLIYEVEASDSFRANMSLLNESSSYLAVSDAAYAYWHGDQGSWPAEWEELLKPPVTVLRQVG